LEDLFVKACGANILAGAAIRAESPRDPFEHGEAAQQTEQAPERAEVLTPIAFLKTFEKEDENQKQKGDKRQGIESCPEGKYEVSQKMVGGFDGVSRVAENGI
jgi:hypothetical protein